ncbi:MAG: NADH-quinone oxidoreductase subunit G [Burkholderiales bacterium]|nr:MAG: NADH-quinone oxidoreductase subunit G [Betaproteobacteria bacterium]TAG28881.1 MAG: NADH-quinone oxidoreductase subunit G [Burkholderiales bacterium]
MVNIEIDGKAVQVPPGSTVMDAATQVGAYVPHFCYHKKLSIAANCRMCLVQVEKAPKPLPACATPVTEGMKVFTASDYAKNAQKSVMEFLLINHPLDCPICDQGGECQLQDLAVGYGKSESRYEEEKRVVFVKNIGPLVSAEEMSRCIQCTRCVRFGQEVAGIMELGMGGRGEHSEILSFVGKSVDSELSGNMIDVCPVGALTSKPFRYSARTWELQRRKTVSPHDGLNANLQVQVKGDKVMRVLPRENEALNECWISDRDRFSYEGLYHADRVTSPLVKTEAGAQAASWQDALTAAASIIAQTAKTHGGNEVAFVLGPHTTLEEAFLAKRIATALGSNSIDYRDRVSDAALDQGGGVPWLGLKVSDFALVDRFLVVGSSLRQEQPLLASRIRARVKKGATLSFVGTTDDELLCPVVAKSVVKPSDLLSALAGVAVALAQRLDKPSPISDVVPSPEALQIAASLVSGKRVAVLLGELALSSAQASQIESMAHTIAALTGGTAGRMTLAATALGAHIVGAVPGPKGHSASAALAGAAKTAVLIGFDAPRLMNQGVSPDLSTLSNARIIALNAFVHEAMKAKVDIVLPIAPFTETSGTYVSQDGTVQSFTGVVRPLGETRPGWKVLRVLGDLLHADMGAFNTSEDVRDAALAAFDPSKLGNKPAALNAQVAAVSAASLERIADVPIYHADPIVRRASSLAKSAYGKQGRVRMNAETAKHLGLSHGTNVAVTQGAGRATSTLSIDASVPNGAVRVPLYTEVSAQLGNASLPITVVAA